MYSKTVRDYGRYRFCDIKSYHIYTPINRHIVDLVIPLVLDTNILEIFFSYHPLCDLTQLANPQVKTLGLAWRNITNQFKGQKRVKTQQ